MLNQEESILDKKYRLMVKEDVPTGGLIHFEEIMAALTSRKADIDNQHRAAILMRKYLSIPSSTIPSKYRKILIVRLIELSHQE